MDSKKTPNTPSNSCRPFELNAPRVKHVLATNASSGESFARTTKVGGVCLFLHCSIKKGPLARKFCSLERGSAHFGGARLRFAQRGRGDILHRTGTQGWGEQVCGGGGVVGVEVCRCPTPLPPTSHCKRLQCRRLQWKRRPLCGQGKASKNKTFGPTGRPMKKKDRCAHPPRSITFENTKPTALTFSVPRLMSLQKKYLCLHFLLQNFD